MRPRTLALSLALPCSSLALAACGGGVSEISTPPAAAEPAPAASAASARAPSPSSSARPKTQADALAELGKLEGGAILGVLGQSQDVGQAFGAGGLGLRGVGEGGGGRGEGIGLGGIGGLGHGSGASGKGRGVWRGYGGGYPRARSRVETSKAEGPLTLGVIDRVVYLNGSLFSSCHAKARSATGKATFTLRISGDGSVLAVERGAIDVKSDLVVDCAERVAKGLLFPRAGGDKTSTATIVIRF
jgi:hypothetical protein